MRTALFVVLGVAATIALVLGARAAFAPKPFQPYVTLRVGHGMSTTEAEARVAVPLEREAMQLEGVSSVKTHVDANEVELTIETKPGVAIDGVVFPAIQKVAAVETGAEVPEVRAVREEPLLTYLSLTSTELSATQLHELAEKRIRYELLHVPGVREVEICGPGTPGVMITVDPARLTGPLSEVVDAIRSANVAPKAGVLEGAGQGFVVRGVGNTDVEGLRQLELGGGRRLGDVAEISEQPVDPPCIGYLNGFRAIGLLLRASEPVPLPSASTLPPSVKLQSMTFDRVLHFGAEGSVMALEQKLSRTLREHPAVADVSYEIRSAGGASVATAYVSLKKDSPRPLMKFPAPLPLVSVEGEDLREVRVTGPDLDALIHAAGAVKEALEKQGLDVASTAAPNVPWTRIELDREAMARLSINTTEVTDTLRLIADRGMEVTSIYTQNEVRDVHLQLPGHKLEDLATVRVGKEGVPLAAVAKVTMQSEAAWIDRRDGQREVRLQTDAKKAQLEEALKQVQLPNGVAVQLTSPGGR